LSGLSQPSSAATADAPKASVAAKMAGIQ
jgi:hypothetical protein